MDEEARDAEKAQADGGGEGANGGRDWAIRGSEIVVSGSVYDMRPPAEPFPEDAPIMHGYQYHAPKMRARDKLREIIKILKR